MPYQLLRIYLCSHTKKFMTTNFYKAFVFFNLAKLLTGLLLTTSLSSFANSIKAGTGRFYGRVVDAKTGKGLEAAVVQLWQDGYDIVTHEVKPILLGGQLTEANGDFSLENLPTEGLTKLKIKALGYKDLEKKVAFDVKFDKKTGPEINGNTFDKDLGNLALEAVEKELKEVAVKADEPFMKQGVDRKIYNVDKITTAAGGTAADVLKNIPSVQVDMDNKVTIRNAAPQIYVDGRPTTLSIEQIPAQNIDKVEVITNPSAKYDASSGGGGIINIVLKKEKRMGYNGYVMFGLDRRLRASNIFLINMREKKLNLFASANLFQSKSISEGNSKRENLFGNPIDIIDQTTQNVNQNLFMNASFGFDWLINNRNTLTISSSRMGGNFGSKDSVNATYDSIGLYGISKNIRRSTGDRTFINWGTSLQYKKLFQKEGREFTTDVFWNKATSDFGGNTKTVYQTKFGNSFRSDAEQQQAGSGGTSFVIVQADYANPITDKKKWEFGARAAISSFYSQNANMLYNDSSKQYDTILSQNNNYSYTDHVYGVYANYSREYKKWSYMAGLRAESYEYKGQLIGNSVNQPFLNPYPLSLFPSLYVSCKPKDHHEFNFNFSRKVRRPNFFQLIPYVSFADSLNLSRGNPELKPEFSYLSELAYTYTWERNQTFQANLYFRASTGLMTNVQQAEWNLELNRYLIISTYANANTAYAYGLEMNMQHNWKKKWELNTNVNVYQSLINTDSIAQATSVSQLTVFSKVNCRYKIDKQWSVQVMTDFQSRMSMMPEGSGGGMFQWGGGAVSNSQGYQRATGGLDLAMKYEFSLKKDRKKKEKKEIGPKPGSLVLNFTDILHTRRADMYAASDFYIQNSFRMRDWQMVKITFSYRFGKWDYSFLRRKNSNRNENSNQGF